MAKPTKFLKLFLRQDFLISDIRECFAVENIYCLKTVDFLKTMRAYLEGAIEKRGWQAADFARVMLELYVEEGRNPLKDM